MSQKEIKIFKVLKNGTARRSKYIKIADFCEKYGIEINTIYVKRSVNDYPKGVFKSFGVRELFINEDWFLRRETFKRKVWLSSHDAYYFLTAHLSSYQLAGLLYKIDSSKTVNGWNIFMNESLFSYSQDSILNYKISVGLYKFFRYTRWLIRGLFIIFGRFVKDRKKIVSNILDNC